MAYNNAVLGLGAGLLTLSLAGCVIAPVEPVALEISTRPTAPAPVAVSVADPGYYGQPVYYSQPLYYWPPAYTPGAPAQQQAVQPSPEPAQMVSPYDMGYPPVVGYPGYNGYSSYPLQWAPVAVEQGLGHQ